MAGALPDVTDRTTLAMNDPEVAAEFRERKPDDMTNGEYLAFLLDKRRGVPDDVQEIAEAVERKVSGQLGIEKHEIRDAARTGAKQGLREVQ